jgi:hypothetical protein
MVSNSWDLLNLFPHSEKEDQGDLTLQVYLAHQLWEIILTINLDKD